ncbi:MAG: DGQHR domain-containing protein, partial [Phycisphaerae bacterium]
TNILVNFTRAVRFYNLAHDEATDITHGRLHLPDRYRSAWIIDGQHRLYGFSAIEDRFLDQNIVVVAFERLAKEVEANLFVTINHEQKSVPKHLLDDLEGELKWGSDVPSERIGAIAARLINILNTDIGEPFHNRVIQQGINSTSKMCLTIPAIKDALRRSGLLGRTVLNNSNYELGPLCGKDDAETLDKARSALNLYFSRVRNANLEQWESGREGCLCTNTAVQAHLMLFASLIKYMEANSAQTATEMASDDILMEIEEFWQPVLDAISKPKLEEVFGAVPFGSGGPPEYYYRLCRICKARFADFSPDGMENWEAEQSEEKIAAADRRLKEIVVAIQKHIFAILRSRYGEQGDAYWHKGITDKAIKADAYKRSLDEDDDARLPLENYLDVIDYKKIVENKQNWPFFSNVFNIEEPGEKGHAKNLKWLDRINELRRIPGHPSEKRNYRVNDFEYIEFVHRELLDRIGAAKESPPLAAEGEVGGTRSCDGRRLGRAPGDGSQP